MSGSPPARSAHAWRGGEGCRGGRGAALPAVGCGAVRSRRCAASTEGRGGRSAGSAPSWERGVLQTGVRGCAGARPPFLTLLHSSSLSQTHTHTPAAAPARTAHSPPSAVPPPPPPPSCLTAHGSSPLGNETGNSHQSSPASHGPEKGVWGGGGSRRGEQAGGGGI